MLLREKPRTIPHMCGFGKRKAFGLSLATASSQRLKERLSLTADLLNWRVWPDLK